MTLTAWSKEIGSSINGLEKSGYLRTGVLQKAVFKTPVATILPLLLLLGT